MPSSHVVHFRRMAVLLDITFNPLSSAKTRLPLHPGVRYLCNSINWLHSRLLAEPALPLQCTWAHLLQVHLICNSCQGDSMADWRLLGLHSIQEQTQKHWNSLGKLIDSSTGFVWLLLSHFCLSFGYSFVLVSSASQHLAMNPWLLLKLFCFLSIFRFTPATHSQAIDTLLWIVAVGVLVTIVFLPHPAYNNQTQDVVPFAFYAALSRPIWAATIAFLIWACQKGLARPVNWILSFPIYEPLARLSYAVYIVHYPLKMQITAFQRTAEYWSGYMWFLFFLSLLGMSLLVAIPLVIGIEYPVRHLEEAIDEAIRESEGLTREPSTRRSFFRMPRIKLDKKTAF